VDTLAGTDDRALNDEGPLDGVIDDAQATWLTNELANLTKPTIVCSHHSVTSGVKVGSDTLQNLCWKTKFVKAAINGHEHYWKASSFGKWANKGNWIGNDIKRIVGLPTNTLWGDIGYVTMRITPERAIATLVETDYYYPKPTEKSKRMPYWDIIRDERNGQRCIISLA